MWLLLPRKRLARLSSRVTHTSPRRGRQPCFLGSSGNRGEITCSQAPGGQRPAGHVHLGVLQAPQTSSGPPPCSPTSVNTRPRAPGFSEAGCALAPQTSGASERYVLLHLLCPLDEHSEARRGNAFRQGHAARKRGAARADTHSSTTSLAACGRAEPDTRWGDRPVASWAERKLSDTQDQRNWVTGEALGESQNTAKDSELEIEFFIINKRPDRALPAEALGCLQPAWGTQEATALSPQDSLVIVQTVGGTGSWGMIFKPQRGGEVNILGWSLSYTQIQRPLEVISSV